MSFSVAYVWQDFDAPVAEQKFGDHFSEAKTWKEAEEETRRYIRGSLHRQKHKMDEGRVVIHKIWNVTEYAKLKNRFGKHQKIDDVLRVVIPGHVQADIHRIEADKLITLVNQELIKHKQPMPVAGLSQWQYDTVLDNLNAIRLGARTIVNELCARFGKTIWAGAMVLETKTDLTIVASYVLTSFYSFMKDFSSFEQFRNLELVDTKDDDYQERINKALKEGKQVVAFLSMCKGSQRAPRIKFLFSRKCSRMLIVDEADFGAYRKGQVQPLIDGRKEDDIVALMTGTGADKAAAFWNPDHYHSVTYPELLLEKSKAA
jgi:hypothetical protein